MFLNSSKMSLYLKEKKEFMENMKKTKKMKKKMKKMKKKTFTKKKKDSILFVQKLRI